jgi:hypothetical protein
MKKIVIFLALIFLNNCGFTPVYLSSENSVINSIKSIDYGGDEILGKQIIRGLNLNIKGNNRLHLLVDSTKKKVITSKNSSNVATGYMMSIDINLNILENDKIVIEKTFSKNFTYNNRDNKFELLNYERSIEKNLINDVTDEIYIFLNLTNDN